MRVEENYENLNKEHSEFWNLPCWYLGICITVNENRFVDF